MATVTVRPPELGDWQGATSATPADGYYTLTADGGTLTCPIDLLQPGRRYTLDLRLGAITQHPTAARMMAVIGGSSVELPATTDRVALAFAFTVDRPIEVVIVGAASLRVYDDTALTADVPDHQLQRPQLPGDVLALDVMTPRPGANVFRLNSSRLDRDALTVGTPWPGTFQLDHSRLGGAYLHRPDLIEWWTGVGDQARAVTVKRGTSGTVVPTAEVGTLAAEFPNAVDPRALGLRKGTPVRLYHWQRRRLIFGGHLTRAQVVPSKPGKRLRYVTQIEAADAVAELAGITRHGAIGIEPWHARVDRLMASAQGLHLPYRIAPAVTDHTPTMGNTVLETSLAQHLDVLAASARGAWWVDREGIVTLCPGPPDRPTVATFTDVAQADDERPWYYVDATAGWDWQAVVSVVELTNYGAAWDSGQGEWAEANTEAAIDNPTLLATYGYQGATVATNLADPADAIALAQQLVHHQDSVADVTAVELNALADTARAAELDLFDVVVAELRGERRPAHIASLTHTITPRAWTTQAALMERTA